jgi:hypothetical protein
VSPGIEEAELYEIVDYNRFKQEVFMNDKLLKGIGCVQRWIRPASGTEHGIGKKRMPFAAWTLVCLILIGVLLPATLCVADQQDPRETAIAADLAAGTDIEVIIQNAVTAGLSVDRAVAAIINAGADPGRVVYAAIIANFAASDVVKGAAAAVAQMGVSDAPSMTRHMAAIIQAATQAGATTSQVNGGLSNAGIPANVIANANSMAASSTPPVYGYTAPPGSPPPTGEGTLGGGGGLIGGSGVGAPPSSASGTRPASPTQP